MTSNIYSSFFIYIPEIFFLTIIFISFLFGLYTTTSKTKNFPSAFKEVTWLCILGMLITILLLKFLPKIDGFIFNNLIIQDSFTVYIKICILFLSIIVLLLSLDYCLKKEISMFEFPILIAFSTFAMLLLVSSYNLLLIYMSIELQALCSYILLGIQKETALSSEASLKYFILSALSTCFFLFGSSLIYGGLGTVSLIDLHFLFSKYINTINLLSLKFGFVCLLISFLFKLGVAPFHAWVPDIFQGGPLIVIAFFSIVSKFALLIVFLRVIIIGFANTPIIWQDTLIICSFFSVLIGSLSGIRQKNIRRLLGYSSINHLGLILMGLASGTLEGVASVFIYIFVYIIMSINIWSYLILVNSKKEDILITLSQFSQFSSTNFILTLVLYLSMGALAGIPPFIGYFAKYFLFYSSINSYFYIIVLLNLFIGAFSVFFYMRIIKIATLDTPKINFISNIKNIPANILIISTFILSLFIFMPEFVLISSYKLAFLLFFTLT